MKIRSLLFAASVLAATAAYASGYEDLVKEIDSQLIAKTELTEEVRAQVLELRNESATLHEEGKVDESVEKLEEALALLSEN